jgi:hypothetical protein
MTGALGKRFEQNVPRGMIHAPLLVAQGLADPLILPAMQRRYVNRLCRAGQRLQYRTYTSASCSHRIRHSSPISSPGHESGSLGSRRRPGARPSSAELPNLPPRLAVVVPLRRAYAPGWLACATLALLSAAAIATARRLTRRGEGSR